MRLALEKLQNRTGASVVGFLWLSDDGELKPKQLFPPGRVRQGAIQQVAHGSCLPQTTRGLDRHARRLQSGRNTGTLDDFSEAICVPLVHEATTLGALHLYREQGQFTQRDFDISISLANMLVVALVRARQQALLAPITVG